MKHHSSLRCRLLLSLFLLALSPGCEQTEAQQETRTRSTAPPSSVALPQARPVAPGQVFPGHDYGNLNDREGQPERIDLAGAIGSKPVVLCYWIAGHPRSETIFKEIENLVAEVGADKLAFYGVAVQQEGRGADVIRSRLNALAMNAPVIDDQGFIIGKQLQVQSSPSIAILDSSGRLMLANGASLAQVLEYNVNLADAIRRVADSGTLRQYGYLAQYYPVKELEGKPCPDFTAPYLVDNVEHRWRNVIDDRSVNVLIFWSVDCGHCRKQLPEINDYLKSNPAGVNVFSAASIPTEAMRVKTREFCELNDFRFPVFVDKDARIATQFDVTTTPTILIVGPDGVVDSAVTSSHSDFGATIEEKKRALLGNPS